MMIYFTYRGWFLWEACMQYCTWDLWSWRCQESSSLTACWWRWQIS